jgi:putative component of membrane protein insertase Oxa1/YidC/SpoIIIJ protein YidD
VEREQPGEQRQGKRRRNRQKRRRLVRCSPWFATGFDRDCRDSVKFGYDGRMDPPQSLCF